MHKRPLRVCQRRNAQMAEEVEAVMWRNASATFQSLSIYSTPSGDVKLSSKQHSMQVILVPIKHLFCIKYKDFVTHFCGTWKYLFLKAWCTE